MKNLKNVTRHSTNDQRLWLT